MHLKYHITFLIGFIVSGVFAQISDKRITLDNRPNIVWIIADGISNDFDFGYQGNKLVNTPNIDQLAREGVDFTNIYSVNPICSPSRSGLITGMFPTTLGLQSHRYSRGKYEIKLPKEIQSLPSIFRNEGYCVFNVDESLKNEGKTDYNFKFYFDSLYSIPKWDINNVGKPYFAQAQLQGGKYRHIPFWWEKVQDELYHLISADKVKNLIPPYYPNDSMMRASWANYLNSVQYTDMQVGYIIQKLKIQGCLGNTVIFFTTDHGVSFARGKQFLYDEGTKIPLIIWAPNLLPPKIRRDLVSNIDIAATSMYFAGIKIPDYMEAQPLFGPSYKPRSFVICARDRADETVDRIRSIRMGEFKFIHNYYPGRPYLQPNVYKDKNVLSVTHIKNLQKQFKLNKIQSLIVAKYRPAEELYDFKNDPFEIHNLSNDPKYFQILNELKDSLTSCLLKTDDQGQYGESEISYNTSMEAYLKEVENDKEYYKIFKREYKYNERVAGTG